MKNTFQATLAALLLSSVAVAPLATLTVMATADAAYAKSDKAGGSGNGKAGDKSQGSSKSSAGGSSKGKSGTKSASTGGGKSSSKKGGVTVEGLFQKLTGKGKKSGGGSAKIASTKATGKPEKGLTHPSNLGKMNGPLHANVNALIAHVKNGNTNGPIGGMAALAVANYAAIGAEEVLELANKFAALDQMLIDNDYVDDEGNPDLQAYLDALEGVPGNGENEVIEASLRGDEGSLPLEEALMGSNNGVQDFTLEEYEAWRDGVAGADPIEGAGDLITELDGQDRPDPELIDYYNDRIADRTAAEDYMLSIWNKGDGDDSARSDEETQLLELLNDRLAADGDALTGAIEEFADLPEPPMPEEEPAAECAAEDPECGSVEEVAAATE